MKAAEIRFTDDEKRELTMRLKAAATEKRHPVAAIRLKRVCAAGIAAACTLACAGAVGAFRTPLFEKAGAKLSINGQAIPSEARMVLNTDGTATITVEGDGETTVITAPEATVKAMLDGETNCGFEVSRPEGGEYELEEQDGRLWLFVNGRIPLDVTDMLEEGYTFSYTGKDGKKLTATVSGSVDNYDVK